MSGRTATGADVRVELWRSFVSLLRSYAAVASMNGVAHEVLVLGEGTAHVCTPRSTLKLSYHRLIGKGSWVLEQGTDRHLSAVQPRRIDGGDFDLNLDGSMVLDGALAEMDFAAIQLIAALTQRAVHDQAVQEEAEVPA